MKTTFIKHLVFISIIILFPIYSLNAQFLEYVESDEELYDMGKHAYRQGNFKDAAMFLYALAQRHPSILENKKDNKDFIAALSFATNYLIAAAEVKGDTYTKMYEKIDKRPDIIAKSPNLNREKIELPYEYTSNKYGIVKDPRDGQMYATIKLAGKTWLAENLNYTIKNSWCYNNKDQNCKKYGRLYNSRVAYKACSGLGKGWRLPRDSDWRDLIEEYGGYKYNEKVFYALTVGGTSGFNAKIAGMRLSNGKFAGAENMVYYWRSPIITQAGNSRIVVISDSKNVELLTAKKNNIREAFSCRCVKD